MQARNVGGAPRSSEGAQSCTDRLGSSRRLCTVRLVSFERIVCCQGRDRVCRWARCLPAAARALRSLSIQRSRGTARSTACQSEFTGVPLLRPSQPHNSSPPSNFESFSMMRENEFPSMGVRELVSCPACASWAPLDAAAAAQTRNRRRNTAGRLACCVLTRLLNVGCQ